ncbi:MAG TPA: hypothetical protein VKV17_03175 [Bryobacteraceae bacterium]|nr:hypothetical protein [Bryobacteraceae bacterium]
MSIFGWLVSFSLIAPSANVITFDHDSIGNIPAGWTVPMTDRSVPPKWQILRDPSAPTPPNVLGQVSSGPRQDRYALAVVNRISMRDGDLSVRFKPVSGHNQAGGIVFRYRDEKNYYALLANAMGDDVALYKVENGQSIPITPRGSPPSDFQVKHDIHQNAWQILKVSLRGNQFQIYVNHRRLFRAQDATFAGPGKVGLCTVSDSVTYFDDFRANPQ